MPWCLCRFLFHLYHIPTNYIITIQLQWHKKKLFVPSKRIKNKYLAVEQINTDPNNRFRIMPSGKWATDVKEKQRERDADKQEISNKQKAKKKK